MSLKCYKSMTKDFYLKKVSTISGLGGCRGTGASNMVPFEGYIQERNNSWRKMSAKTEIKMKLQVESIECLPRFGPVVLHRIFPGMHRPRFPSFSIWNLFACACTGFVFAIDSSY